MENPGLDDPRAVDILTTEHWSLLSTRNLGYQEMFGRTTIFVATVSGTIVALALLAKATPSSGQTLWFALLLMRSPFSSGSRPSPDAWRSTGMTLAASRP